MSDDAWYGASGDWNYRNNWSSGVAPVSGQSAVLSGQAPETITGSGYFSSLILEATNITLSGDFEGFDETATIADTVAGQGTSSGTTSQLQTASVSPWGIVVTGRIALSHTDLLVQGALLVDQGNLKAVTVSGGEGFLGVSTGLQVGSLTALGGSEVNGNLSFVAGGTIEVDDQSSLGIGTLSATGATSIAVLATGGSTAYSFSNDFFTTDNGCFTFTSTSNGSLTLDGAVSGTGTLAFNDEAISVADAGSFTGTFDLTSSTMLLEGDASSGPLTFLLNGSSLTVPQSGIAQAVQDTVVCSGSSDTVNAGLSSIIVSATGTTALSFTGGLGTATVRGGAGSLMVNSGTGNTVVRCGSGSNLITVGGGNDAVYGSSGASITVIDGGQTTVTSGAGNETVDATGSTGNDIFVGGSAGGTTTILGGTGSSVVFGMQGAISVVGGTGNLIASGGTSGKDTLVGGSGANTLFARSTGTQVHGSGSATNVLVAVTGGINLDATNCTGAATLFATGGAGGVTTLTGGSGSDVLVTPNGNASILGGSGTELIWGGTTAADTIIGGTGNSTMVGGAGSQIELNGSAKDLVLAYGGGATVNAAQFRGTSVIWTGGTGVSNVICGGGSETVVAGSGTLHAIGGSGFNAIWGGDSGHDTIVGGTGINALFGQSGAYLKAVSGGTNYMQASGANVTLNGGASTGWERLVDTQESSGDVIYTGQGVSEVQILGTSAAVHVVGGQVSLDCGLGLDTIWLDTPSVSGTLNIFGFDPLKDHISSPGLADVRSAGSSAPSSGEVVTIAVGNETIILHA